MAGPIDPRAPGITIMEGESDDSFAFEAHDEQVDVEYMEAKEDLTEISL